MGRDAHELAQRDPALAALMGVLGPDFGYEDSSLVIDPVLLTGDADFGGYNEGPDFGSIFGDLWSESYDQDYTQGVTEMAGQAAAAAGMGSLFGGDSVFGYSAVFGADPAAPAAAAAAAHGATPQGRAIIAQHVQRQQHRNNRALLLEPNKYSDLKVERYTFAVNATITALGTSGAITGSNSPDVNFRPQRVTANVVSPGMILLTEGRVANVSFTVGGTIDAWQFNANAVGQHLDVPTLTPANKATFIGTYTGLVPSPLSGTGAYTFSLAFTGPASIVA